MAAYNRGPPRGGFGGPGPGPRGRGGMGPPRGPPPRQYPPGPGPPQQQHPGPGPGRQYDQYDDPGYDQGYNNYDDGYDGGYGGGGGAGGGGGQYGMGPPRGGPPNPDYSQDYNDYGPSGGPNGRGGGRGGMRGPPMGGRGGPMRPPNFDGGRGVYPPRGGGGYPQGPGRDYPSDMGGRGGPPGRGGNPNPRGPPMDGFDPMTPADDFGGGAYPSFPGANRRPDFQQEEELASQMGGMSISNQRPGLRGPSGPGPGRGPMPPPGSNYGGPGGPGPRGPPQSYDSQGYPDERGGPPPGPGYRSPMADGYQDGGFGPPARSMTMPTRDPMDMRAPAPPRQNGGPGYDARVGRGAPPRPNTAQGNRMYSPATGPSPQDDYREPGYGNPPPSDSGYQTPQSQQRPASFDDFYDNYYDDNARNSTDQSGQYQSSIQSAGTGPQDYDSQSGQRPNSYDRQRPGQSPETAQRGPGRVPEVSRTKSQPDLRNSQTAVFEMAGDIPPMPAPGQYGQQQAPGRSPDSYQQSPMTQQGYQPSPGSQQGPLAPGSGLPSHPAPYRVPTQQTPSPGSQTPDSLPSHPAPVRPGHMPGSVVNLSDRPPPVRNYSGYSGSTSTPTPSSTTSSVPPPSQLGSAPPPAKPVEAPVTIEELEQLRAVIKQDPNDQTSALRLAKRLVEASDVLVRNLPDPKARARSAERYLVDAHKILRKLEKASNPEAMFFLADCLGRGIFGNEPDNAHAFSLYQSAAKLGHAAAAYRTAVCCEIGNEDGGGTRKDPLKAIQWYKRAATLGDTPAMYKVGMILLKGLLGQPVNPREAVSWLKRAAERADAENPHALHELALLYEDTSRSDIVIPDQAYALQLFTQAAELGYKFSQFRLGWAYEYGLMGCPIDPRLSIMWYSRAATQEEHQSELALSGWYLTGSEGVLNASDTEAYLWARKAAVAGLAKAEFAMGYYTENGIGVPRSVEDAKRWYWRAAAQDYPKARQRLEELKRTGGKGGPQPRERISRSKMTKQGEGECSVM
ncbi:hypothetical protein B0H66DRAFT_467222 [Apodospora peruviana]|uniref:Chitin synthase regulatory factor 3 n=1 Tax=Apodospora peruviana TaxID=516989 RepID=A0AAE0MFG6_9PEZI|nr:hypothetical protein B0H66DRAFT_467222 [Apodospora peruviana]